MFPQCCHLLFPGAPGHRAGSVDHPAPVPGDLLHHPLRGVAGGEEQVRLELLQGGLHQGNISVLEGKLQKYFEYFSPFMDFPIPF